MKGVFIMNEYLIEHLKKGRLNKGLKQSDVTKLIGIKNTTLSNYENGVTEPDIDTFLSLCELYELDFISIMEEAYGITVPGRDFVIKPSEIEILKQYRSLDPHGKKMVDFTLQEEWERSKEEKEKTNIIPLVKEPNKYDVNAAHERTDIEIPKDVDTSEDDIMDDDNF